MTVYFVFFFLSQHVPVFGCIDLHGYWSICHIVSLQLLFIFFPLPLSVWAWLIELGWFYFVFVFVFLFFLTMVLFCYMPCKYLVGGNYMFVESFDSTSWLHKISQFIWYLFWWLIQVSLHPFVCCGCVENIASSNICMCLVLMYEYKWKGNYLSEIFVSLIWCWIIIDGELHPKDFSTSVGFRFDFQLVRFVSFHLTRL